MSARAYIAGVLADAPTAPAENTRFHQQLLDWVCDQARSARWPGARVDGYDRFNGEVAIVIAPATSGWPELADVRSWRAKNPNAAYVLNRKPYVEPADDAGNVQQQLGMF